MEVEEGNVSVEVPEQPDAGTGEVVFFNPRMELNRDLTVATLAAYRSWAAERKPDTYFDATAATGIRGVRAAAAGWSVTLADTDPDAVRLCERNLERNEVKGEVLLEDANAVLHEHGTRGARFDVTDVDPFGSPIPFTDAAVRHTRRLLCVTATDTAPLCGAHFESGCRRYGAVPRTTEYHPEMGARVLLSALARDAARHDVGVTPLLTHVTDHYVRTYLELERNASAANDTMDGLGYVYHCTACLARDHDHGLIANPPSACWACGTENVVTAGPLWVDAAHDPEFVATVRAAITEEMNTATRARRLLDRIEAELHTPTHYDQHRLAKEWNEPASAMEEFLEALREAGFAASRTHYGGTRFKTDASVPEIREARPDPP